jgi:microcystin-dependent protein
MSEPYIGEIRCLAFNFAPYQWAQCNGQLIGIAQNSALFAILGTTYGGDGIQTFALPNLQGRAPMHWGTGAAGFNTAIGETLGEANVTLNINQIPMHTHTINAAGGPSAAERTAGPKTDGSSFMSNSAGGFIYQPSPSTPNTPFVPNAISMAGNSLPHNNMQPYLTMNFSISLYGVFPTRN